MLDWTDEDEIRHIIGEYSATILVIKNAHKYYAVHPRFEKAFQFILNQQLDTMEVSKFEIDGRDIHGFVSLKEGATRETAKFESHQKYMDIQVCPAGQEEYGWKSLEKCGPSKDGYLEEKDVYYYNETADIHFTLQAGQFAIFFPEDVHSAGVAEGMLKKLVLKVKI